MSMSRLRREVAALDRALVGSQLPCWGCGTRSVGRHAADCPAYGTQRKADKPRAKRADVAAHYSAELERCRGAVERRLRALVQTLPSVHEYARVYWEHLNRQLVPGAPFDEDLWLSKAARSLPKSTKIGARQMIDRICGFGRGGV